MNLKLTSKKIAWSTIIQYFGKIIQLFIAIFITKMLSLNSDITLLSHPLGRHGFDDLDDDEQSRDIIKATIEFLKSRLNRPSAFNSKAAQIASDFYTLLFENKVDAAIDLFLMFPKKNGDKKIIDKLLSEAQLAKLAGSLLQNSNPTGALKFYEFVLEQKPLSPCSHLFIAFCHENLGNIDQAVAQARKAMDLSEKTTEFSRFYKKVFQDAAAALIKRHE